MVNAHPLLYRKRHSETMGQGKSRMHAGDQNRPPHGVKVPQAIRGKGPEPNTADEALGAETQKRPVEFPAPGNNWKP